MPKSLRLFSRDTCRQDRPEFLENYLNSRILDPQLEKSVSKTCLPLS